MRKNFSRDPLVLNIGYLSLLVFVLSLQVLIVLVFIYQFIPLKMDPITQGVPQALLKLFKPNRNHFFYHAFIASAIIGQFLALYLFRKSLNLADLAVKIREFLICETFWVSWQLFAVFKILQYDNPWWARILLYAGFAAALLGKIFWPELRRCLRLFETFVQADVPRRWIKLADAGIILILLSTIAIPDGQKAVSRLAMADNNNHFDQWLMAPLWSFHQGLIPAKGASNPLNWGVPVFVHALVTIIGAMTYAHVIAVLCFLAIAYYLAFYYLLRFWLGALLAVFGVLLAVKLQMFNIGVSPLIWVFPDKSILRHLFDVAVFSSLLLYARGKGEIFLWLASAAVGISLGFVFDTGIYLLGALYAYLSVLLIFKDTRSILCPRPKCWRKILGIVVLPIASMLLVLAFCCGSVIFHREFWIESFKDIPRWLAGADAISIYSCLKDRNFFAFFASFFPPLLYIAGMTATISMVYFRCWKSEKLFLIPLSIYGLEVYAHFLWHASINDYYMVPLPLVSCICFWVAQGLQGLKKTQERLVKLILAAGAVIALFTNVLFTYYPNIFNLSQENWAQEKSYYEANFNIDKDVQFIGQWTSPDQPVALISGFEIQLLLQADRKPFFYKSLALMDQADVQPLIEQLDRYKPSQVFINKGILMNAAAASLSPLVDYLKAHYQYSGRQSDNLALLQRIHE